MLDGGDGNDTIITGQGDDLLIGGAGVDLVDYSSFSTGVEINLASGIALSVASSLDVLVGFSQVMGGSGGDLLNGGDGIDGLSGAGGNDLLIDTLRLTVMFGGDDTLDSAGSLGTGNLRGGVSMLTLLARRLPS
ncbi:MAG: hypothetical protein ACX939_10445, partial [Hyphococcus sp.]